MSLPALELSHPKSWANSNDLYRVEKIEGGLRGVQSLPKNAQTWVLFYVEVLLKGFDEIRAPLSILTDVHHRACPGSNNSYSSTQRAHRVMREHDFLSMRKFRIGHNRYQSVIRLNRKRFEFFLRSKLTDMGNCARTYYNTTQRSICPNDEVTLDSPSLDSSSFTLQDKTASCMPEKKIKRGKPRHADHPVYYSLKCVLFGMKHPRRNEILQLAKNEIAGDAKSSLTDWSYWLARWKDISVDTRENLIERDVLPNYAERFKIKVLVSAGERPGPAPFFSPLGSTGCLGSRSPNSTQELDEIVAAIAGRVEATNFCPGEEPEKHPVTPKQKNFLSPEEFETLRALKKQTRRRRHEM